MATRVGINGFGRIGRAVLRCALDRKDIEFSGINDLTDAATLAHLLKYDSVHGALEAKVEAGQGEIRVNGRSVRVTAERDPAKLPWRELGCEIVIESTGFFTQRADAAKHLAAGAK